MSRIGKKPVAVPGGVSVSVAGERVDVCGPKGKLAWSLPRTITAAVSADKKLVTVTRADDLKQSRALHGLSRALIANMVKGVHEGFSRRLLIFGTGFGCSLAGRKLELNVGFMGRGSKGKAQFSLEIPQGVEVKVEVPSARGESEPAKLVISGCDKQAVGHFAARVRKIRPPEPYKGKGIRYEDEHVRRKQGKTMAGAGSGG